MHAVKEIENEIKVDKERIILNFDSPDTDGVITKILELIRTEHPELTDDQGRVKSKLGE